MIQDLRLYNISKTQQYIHSHFCFMSKLIKGNHNGVLGFWGFGDGEPAHPWVVKWRLSSYLKKHGAWRAIQVPFKFPSKAEMERSPAGPKESAPPKLTSGPASGLDFDSLKHRYTDLKLEALTLEQQIARVQPRPGQTNSLKAQAATLLQDKLAAKEREIAPLWSDLWAFQRAWAAERLVQTEVYASELTAAWKEFSRDLRARFVDAASYETMYQLIAQELWIADRLLASRNREHRRVALHIARQAAGDSLDQAENGWLAARIYEAYILPNLSLADPSGTRFPPLDNLLRESADVFRRNEEHGNVVRVVRMWIARAPSVQAADLGRVQIAMAYENMGEYKLALNELHQLKATNNIPRQVRVIAARLESVINSR